MQKMHNANSLRVSVSVCAIFALITADGELNKN